MASAQRFAAGAVARSPQFLLTLDGEGVELAVDKAELTFGWGRLPADAEFVAESLHLQREIMPLLYNSSAFQQAVAEIVARQRHLRVVAWGKLSRVE